MSCGIFPLIVKITNVHLKHMVFICMPILREFSLGKLQSIFILEHTLCTSKNKMPIVKQKNKKEFLSQDCSIIKDTKSCVSSPKNSAFNLSSVFLSQVLRRVVGTIRNCVLGFIILQGREINPDSEFSIFHPFQWLRKKEELWLCFSAESLHGNHIVHCFISFFSSLKNIETKQNTRT